MMKSIKLTYELILYKLKYNKLGQYTQVSNQVLWLEVHTFEVTVISYAGLVYININIWYVIKHIHE